MKNCQKNAIFFPMLTLTPNLWCFIFAIFLPLARIILGKFLPFHCRLPTAISSKLPFADGNEKYGKTTSIVFLLQKKWQRGTELLLSDFF